MTSHETAAQINLGEKTVRRGIGLQELPFTAGSPLPVEGFSLSQDTDAIGAIRSQILFEDRLDTAINSLLSDPTKIFSHLLSVETGLTQVGMHKIIKDFITGESPVLVAIGTTASGKSTFVESLINFAHQFDSNIFVRAFKYDDEKRKFGVPREQLTTEHSHLLNQQIVRGVQSIVYTDGRRDARKLSYRAIVELPAVKDEVRGMDRGIEAIHDLANIFGPRMAVVAAIPHPEVLHLGIKTRCVALTSSPEEFARVLPELGIEINQKNKLRGLIERLYEEIRKSGFPETILAISQSWFRQIRNAVKQHWSEARKIKLPKEFKGISQTYANAVKRAIYYLTHLAPEEFGTNIHVFLNSPSKIIQRQA